MVAIMTDEQIVCIVDTREPKWMADQVQAYGLTVVQTALYAGDFCFFPHGMKVGIERKTMGDLLSSLRPPSGDRGGASRMVGQVHKLIEFYDASILLIEGQYRPTPSGVVEYETKEGWRESGWGWDSFQAIMLEITWLGIMVHHAPINQAAREVARIVGSLSKKDHKWIKGRERPNVMTIDAQYKNPVWALAAFDKVGVDWADTLVKHYTCFAKVVAASAKSLSEVKRGGKRFGMKRADALVKQFEQAWS